MIDNQESLMSIDTNALIKVFIMVLNNENLINNKTYLAIVNELMEGEK